MNPETKQFAPISDPVPEEKKNWKRFAVGDEVEVHGVPCRIRKITTKDLVLRPVK